MARKTKEESEKTRARILESARRVFHQRGFNQSSLEQIAKDAGLTRGAVYWHFKGKADLLFSLREDVSAPLTRRVDALLESEAHPCALDAIEAAMKEFFIALDDDPVLRQVFEIMATRCEFVGEFSDMQEELDRPGKEFLVKMEGVYARALSQSELLAPVPPAIAARDTWIFINGLMRLVLGSRRDPGLEREIPQTIAAHIALRRAPRPAHHLAAPNLLTNPE